MARTSRGRRKSYDNIAVGSAISSKERTINGALPPSFVDTIGGIENIAVAADYGAERTVSGSALMTGERLG